MDEQEMRKNFERIFMLTNYDQGLGEACLVRAWKDEDNSPYSFNRTEYLWTLWKFAWQASREALVIELPEGESLFQRMYGVACERPHLIERKHAVAAIEAAGVKVK